MPTLYIDCDDVVTETARHLIDLRRAQCGWGPDFEDMFDFDLHKSLRLSDTDYPAFMEHAHTPAELALLAPLPGACETLRAWLDDGLHPIIVTGRPACSHAATRAWFDARGLADLPLLLVDKYNRHLGADIPGIDIVPFHELHSRHFDLAIDDAPLALDLIATHALCPAVVFDRPWNRSYNPSTPRVHSWHELDAFVRAHL